MFDAYERTVKFALIEAFATALRAELSNWDFANRSATALK